MSAEFPELAFTFKVTVEVTVYGTSLESTAWSVNVDVPAVVGVPERIPVVVLKLRPAGREPFTGSHFNVGVPPVRAKVVL